MPISSILPYRLKNKSTCEWMVKVSTAKVLIPDTNALLQSMPLSAWLAILQFWRLVTPYGGVNYETRPGLQNDVCINRISKFWGAHLCASMFYFWVGHSWLIAQLLHCLFLIFSETDLALGARNFSPVHLDPSFQPCGQGFSWYVCCLSYFNDEPSQKHQGVFRDAPPHPKRLVLKSIPWCVSSTWPVPYKVVKMIFGKKVRSTRNIYMLSIPWNGQCKGFTLQ